LRDNLRALRRRQIIRAAGAIVARDGLEALTIAQLEAQLGYTRGVITYHFKNKDEIVDELLHSAVEEIDLATSARLASAESQEARIGALIGGVVRGFLDHLEASRILIAFWGRIHVNSRMRKVNAALYARYRKTTAKLLGCDEAQAAIIVGVVIGIVAQAYFDPAQVDVEAAVEEAARAVTARLKQR